MTIDLTLHDFVTDTAFAFIAGMAATRTLDDLIGCVNSVLEKLGIDAFTFYEFTAAQSNLIEGSFPTEWTDRYKEHGYDVFDPVFRRLRYDISPFDWRELSMGFSKGPKSKRVLNEATEFGLRDGFTIPICDLTGVRGVLSFSARHIEPHPKLLPALHLISVYAHAKYNEIKANAEPESKALSDREIECLHWSAAGKTDWEIGMILSISETTVRTHLEHVRTKLNATNKVHAVAEALRRHILIP